MEKIVFKKSWIERMDNMDRWTRHRCIIALYELLYFGRITPPGLRGGPEVLQFIRSIAKEVAADTERRERMQKRREEKKTLAEREAKALELKGEQAVEQTITEASQGETPQSESTQNVQPIFKSIDYTAHPEMFIIEGFIKYLIATGNTQLSSILPKGSTLASLERSLNHCFSTGQRYSNISRLTSTMKSQLRHALKQCIC